MESRIQDYHLKSKIAEGAFGEIWKAVPKERPTQMVALKILKNAKNLKLLGTEVQTLQKLDHPSIVKIHSARLDEEPYYLELEYCPTLNTQPHSSDQIFYQTLKAWLKTQDQSKYSRPLFFWIQKKILEAVGFLHEKKVVHGDLKPENILVSEAGEIKIIDFGLSKCYDLEGLSQSLSQTLEIAQGGTLYYLAPELVRQATSTFASDIFSLGVIFYEMSIGYNYPLDSLRTFRPKYERIFLKQALAHNPEKRFQNGLEMLEAFFSMWPEREAILLEYLQTKTYLDFLVWQEKKVTRQKSQQKRLARIERRGERQKSRVEEAKEKEENQIWENKRRREHILRKRRGKKENLKKIEAKTVVQREIDRQYYPSKSEIFKKKFIQSLRFVEKWGKVFYFPFMALGCVFFLLAPFLKSPTLFTASSTMFIIFIVLIFLEQVSLFCLECFEKNSWSLILDTVVYLIVLFFLFFLFFKLYRSY